MDAVRITDFAILSGYEDRDKIHLQRREAGVWNDYHTDMVSYLGEVKTVVFNWDMSNAGDFIEIPCPVGKYLVLISAHYTYTPGSIFGSNLVQNIIQNASGSWVYVCEFTHDGSGRGGIFSPAVGSGPVGNIYGGVDESIGIYAGDTSLVSPDQGTCRIVVQYVEVTPL